MKKSCFLFLIIFIHSLVSFSQNEIIDDSNTINVGYTYWWPNADPLLNYSAEKCPLVFIGKLINLDKAIIPKEDEAPVITQKGTIEIITIIKKEELPKQKFTGQKYFSTDCFYKSNLKIGDYVLVFCYAYEDMYCVPGKESILKISDY